MVILGLGFKVGLKVISKVLDALLDFRFHPLQSKKVKLLHFMCNFKNHVIQCLIFVIYVKNSIFVPKYVQLLTFMTTVIRVDLYVTNYTITFSAG